MKSLVRVATLAVLMIASAHCAWAIEPAYKGPLGNPEEPAMRPYKWMWRGIKSFMYQPIVALDQGNRKIPGLGTVNLTRGIRRGSVELTESVARGIVYERPPAKDSYKQLGAANKVIDNDPLLNNVADLLAPGLVDAYPVTSPEERAKMDEKIKADQRAREEANAKARDDAEAAHISPMDRARQSYVGDRIKINSRPPLTGNLMRLAR